MVIYNRCFAFGDHFAALWVTGIYGSVDGKFKGLTVEGLAVGTTGDKPFYLRMPS